MKLSKALSGVISGLTVLSLIYCTPTAIRSSSGDIGDVIEPSYVSAFTAENTYKTSGETHKKMNQTKLTAVEPGTWGGTGVRVTVEKDDIKIEYDCADGEIRQPLKIDKNGNFKLDGFHKRGTFGPIRVGNEPKFVPATYEGKIDGKTMTYKVTLSDSNEVVGEYTVELDKVARIRKCR